MFKFCSFSSDASERLKKQKMIFKKFRTEVGLLELFTLLKWWLQEQQTACDERENSEKT